MFTQRMNHLSFNKTNKANGQVCGFCFLKPWLNSSAPSHLSFCYFNSRIDLRLKWERPPTFAWNTVLGCKWGEKVADERLFQPLSPNDPPPTHPSIRSDLWTDESTSGGPESAAFFTQSSSFAGWCCPVVVSVFQGLKTFIYRWICLHHQWLTPLFLLLSL